MLRSLRIENLVLVREGKLAPGAALTAITGETGAGKTILTQAVGLLLGAKGDAGIVGAAGYLAAGFSILIAPALVLLAAAAPPLVEDLRRGRGA